MRSVILQTTTRLVFAIMIIFSVFLFFRGHNEPGGGFIGGLMASSAVWLIYIAFGLEEGDAMLPFNYRRITAIGLLAAGLASIIPMFTGLPFLTSQFYTPSLPIIGELELSTVLLFDFGVYLVVFGTMVEIVRVLVLEKFQEVSVHHRETDTTVTKDGNAWRP